MLVKIGIGLPNQVRNLNAGVIPAWAALAEQAGFSTVSTVGRLAYPGVMDTVALAAAAGATRTIGLLSTIMLAPAWPGTLFAKEIASIDGVSGGRLTLGIGVGGRADDFLVESSGFADRGRRMDRDLETYRSVWGGEPVGGSPNPAVPPGARQIPLLFGAGSRPALRRMAQHGEGYVSPSVPAAMAGQTFDAARAAWREAGRSGEPRLVAIAYFAIADPDTGRANVADYYADATQFVDIVVDAVRTTPAEITQAVKEFEAIGADELILNPTSDDPGEIASLAELVG
ncbi:LLM class flavin-dependent oxidoreductase [Streptacidiphilus carbonis]|jgi:alkanesulfonate monooxygenase SsuD/methylene tetrahydromethanopterin reductase-like flavin-dependent oxidoreductase (luciferase family)|uniref:LLM class flavin-dependent oxidoreductase n=1 Tax=Streptacidiphilus carbonis TaxID=105422 RepID=UPI001F374FCF|nr:LLM class flavin-dependent oxidoreductase [Streptacidiphilus carbonis]